MYYYLLMSSNEFKKDKDEIYEEVKPYLTERIDAEELETEFKNSWYPEFEKRVEESQNKLNKI